MGQCLFKAVAFSRLHARSVNSPAYGRAPGVQLRSRLRLVGLDVPHLITEALEDVRSLRSNDDVPPTSLAKLNLIAENEEGWKMVVANLVEHIPLLEPMAPLVICLFIDESPLPNMDTVVATIEHLLGDISFESYSFSWHRSLCLVVKCLAEKLTGCSSTLVSKTRVLKYLYTVLLFQHYSYTCLYAVLALESLAGSTDTCALIVDYLQESGAYDRMVAYSGSVDFMDRQLGFCIIWALDNILVVKDRVYGYQQVNLTGINAMLDQNSATDYLKMSPDGLEARSDASSFESVRCTFGVSSGIWYYEVLIITSGVMQIGWVTKNCRFANLEGCGVGDDVHSVAYDGYRQLIWHNSMSASHTAKQWMAGDILGCLIDADNEEISFYLNGELSGQVFRDIFHVSQAPFYAAASFMTCQQCRFNFGYEPFKYAPSNVAYMTFNDHGQLSDERKVILPKKQRLEILMSQPLSQNACDICYDRPGTVVLQPCSHGKFCTTCVDKMRCCPFCRAELQMAADE